MAQYGNEIYFKITNKSITRIHASKFIAYLPSYLGAINKWSSLSLSLSVKTWHLF